MPGPSCMAYFLMSNTNPVSWSSDCTEEAGFESGVFSISATIYSLLGLLADKYIFSQKNRVNLCTSVSFSLINIPNLAHKCNSIDDLFALLIHGTTKAASLVLVNLANVSLWRDLFSCGRADLGLRISSVRIYLPEVGINSDFILSIPGC